MACARQWPSTSANWQLLSCAPLIPATLSRRPPAAAQSVQSHTCSLMCSDNPNLLKEANKAKCFAVACFVLCASQLPPPHLSPPLTQPPPLPPPRPYIRRLSSTLAISPQHSCPHPYPHL